MNNDTASLGWTCVECRHVNAPKRVECVRCDHLRWFQLGLEHNERLELASRLHRLWYGVRQKRRRTICA